MLRDDFPFFKSRSDLVYLDNAATTQKPRIVIDAVARFMTEQNSNTGRSLYPLASEAADAVNDVRLKTADFINAYVNEIIFTKGSTEALNMVSSSICRRNRKGNIVITELEHSSNYAPWLDCCRKTGIEFRVAKVEGDGSLKTETVKSMIDSSTLAVAISGMSNVNGFMPDIQTICRYAKEHGALTVVDAAQLVVHHKIDVEAIGCDYLCLSGHKLYGPQGTGVLYARKESQNQLMPLALGGGAVEPDYRAKKGIEGYEAGSQNVAGLVGIGKAIDYLKQHEDEIKMLEDELSDYLFASLKKLDYIRVINRKASPIVSFSFDGLGFYDVGTMLARSGICIRTGSCCAYNLMRTLKLEGVCRVSVSFCNTKDEIDLLVRNLDWIHMRYGGRG